MKMARSRPPLGQLPATKRCGKLWNSRSVSRKTTGSLQGGGAEREVGGQRVQVVARGG